MAATNEYDQARIDLENILAHLVCAKDCLDKADTRLLQTAVTEMDALTLFEVRRAKIDIHKARRLLAAFHPNRLEED